MQEQHTSAWQAIAIQTLQQFCKHYYLFTFLLSKKSLYSPVVYQPVSGQGLGENGEGGGVECANREIFRDKLGIASAWALSVFKASPPKNRENSTLPSLLPTPPRMTTLLFKPPFLDIILQFCHQTLFTFPDYQIHTLANKHHSTFQYLFFPVYKMITKTTRWLYNDY